MEVPSALFSMVAEECLPAGRLWGRAPQALHFIKIVMNLFSHTSTDKLRWKNLARSLEAFNFSWKSHKTKGLLFCRRPCWWDGPGVKMVFLPSAFVWMGFLAQPHPTQEHLTISSAYSFIHTHTCMVSTWSNPCQANLHEAFRHIS